MTSYKKKPKFLRLLTWNANGINNKKHEFREFLCREMVDVALLSETHLKPNLRANIPNYNCYRNDRMDGRGGGTAIYIKRTLDHYPINNPNCLGLESTIININTAMGNLSIVSCYNSPNSTLSENDFNLLNGLGNKIIIAGDFNAKHVRFRCNTTNANGHKLCKYTDDLNLIICPPTSATRIPPIGQSGRPEILDLIIIKNVIIGSEIEVIPDLSSDHLPLCFTWGIEGDDNQLKYKKYVTNWTHYQERLNQEYFPYNELNINTKVATLEQAILQAHTSSTKIQIKSPQAFSISRETLSLIQQMRKVIKKTKKNDVPR